MKPGNASTVKRFDEGFSRSFNGGGSRSRSPQPKQDAVSSSSDKHAVKKKRELDLNRFRNVDSGTSSRSQTVTLSDSDGNSLSSLSDLEMTNEEKPPVKKRKFIRGGPKANRNLSTSSDHEDGKAEAVAAAEMRADAGFIARAKRIHSLVPHISMNEVERVLVQVKGDNIKALEMLKSQNGSTASSPSSQGKPIDLTSPGTPSVSKAQPPRVVYAVSSSPASSSPTKSLIQSKPNRPQSMPKKGVEVTTKTVLKPLPTMAKLAAPPPQMTRNDSSSSSYKSNGNASGGGGGGASQKAIHQIKNFKKATRIRGSDDDDVASDSDDDGEENEYEQERENKRRALQWFNTSTAEHLQDNIGINATQAEAIISMRTFSSVDDLTTKLSKAKGVTSKMFTNYIDQLAGLQRIDAVLEKCEKMGTKLSTALDKWKDVDGRKAEDYLEEQPRGSSAGVELRDFQLHGVNWLNLLYNTGCSGILADDMGLGKTAQVISLLNHIVLVHQKRPHLIVVPSSVLTNWMREFEMFGPQLRVAQYYGSMRDRESQRYELRSNKNGFDIVITTYDMASGGDKDHKFLRRYDFDAVIFDEGHVLKNQKSVKYTKLTRIGAQWRLLLTGTPLQNNLGELISLLKFIMPTYFRGAEDALTQIFKVDQQTQLSKDRVQRAKQMMQPFVLRRRKIDVLNNLKPKTEKVKYCEMQPEQREIYRQAFAKSKAALLLAQQGGEGGDAKKNRSGHVLMELRKAANHPLLFRRLYTPQKIEALAKSFLTVAEHATDDLTEVKEDFAINSDAELCVSIAMQYPECAKHVIAQEEWLKSGKIAALKEVIDEASSRGDRLVIFSQFVQTLEIICRALEVMGVTYRGFTGSTDVNSRQIIVDEFTNDPSITCFLLSTRAGGVGINLTAANWVVLFDQDFNPQNDRQAADRCYRIGQEKEVTVVRLLSRGTIDERIFELGKGKVRLAERVEGRDEIVLTDGTSADDEASGGETLVNEEIEDEVVQKTMEQKLLQGLLEDDAANVLGGGGGGGGEGDQVHSIAV